MLGTSEYIGLEGLEKLSAWTQAWYERSRSDHFIDAQFEPDVELLRRLHQYFQVGLTPEEAVQACFGTKH